MHSFHFKRILSFSSCLLLFLAACSLGDEIESGQTAVSPTAIAQTTASPTATSSPPAALTTRPSLTPTITPTPSPTPTPTPTAVPIQVSGDPRAALLAEPVPHGNAACGRIDVLDFPLAPPHGESVSGGGDFGVFRSRYDKYHAGEDWWAGNRGGSFGMPVYSIGHGLVTYAEPEGWNRDKGVVIIQHTLLDSTTVLSFYGHLDPPSITLKAGDCIRRGQQVGNIGRPRSSPHLHFEIRTQAPYAPLTGYWPEDPTTVGWLPPSQFIWQQRLLAHPSVAWIRPSAARGQAIGNSGDNFILLEDQQIVGLDDRTGLVRWRLPQADGAFRSAALDAQNEIVYGIDNSGSLRAFQLAAEAGAVPTLLWQAELDALGTPTLLPLPQGGVLAWVRQTAVAVTAEGVIAWRAETPGRLLDWSSNGRSLIMAVDNDDASWWIAGDDGLQALNGPAAGKASSRAGQTWLYTEAGLYRWQPGEETAVLQQPLPAGNVAQGDVLALSDGGVLLAHVDTADRRLIAYTANGRMRWERSYRGQITGRVQLIAWKGHFYLLEWGNGRAGHSVTLYAINMTNGALRKIFVGGARQSSSLNTWSYAGDRAVYIHIGGGSLVVLDPRVQP